MKVFLTSFAADVIDKLVPLLPKPPKDLSTLFIPTGANPYENREWMKEDRDKLKDLGFKVSSFDLKDKTEKEVRTELDNTDIVFVSGGNTFYLLEKVKQSGFDKVVKDFISKGKIYIGSSAGSVILGPNIEPMKYLDDSSKAPTLSDYSGLELIDFIVLPHSDNKNYDKMYKELIEEYKNIYKLQPLNDNQAIVIDGEKIQTIEN